MDFPARRLQDVLKTQLDLYDRMAHTIWGDRMALAMTASSLAGMGMGMLMAKRWGTRFGGTLLYATAAGMQMYAIFTPPARETRRTEAERTRSGETARVA